MSSGRCGRRIWSVAERTGFLALLTAVLLGFLVAPQAAALPLGLFVVACLGAPFFPRWSFFLPMISRGKPGAREIALTFDDGPSPASTPVLLALLAKYELQATFFVIGNKAAAHPELIAAILARGHTIGNHSLRHDYLLVLRGCQALEEDIRATQDILAKAGIHPLVFRPPIGITSPRLQPVLATLQLQTVTFSCRIFDRGNRKVRHLAARALRQLRPGDILLLHDSPPLSAESDACWQNELDQLFSALQRWHHVVPLAELIDHPVMTYLEKIPD